MGKFALNFKEISTLMYPTDSLIVSVMNNRHTRLRSYSVSCGVGRVRSEKRPFDKTLNRTCENV